MKTQFERNFFDVVKIHLSSNAGELQNSRDTS